VSASCQAPSSQALLGTQVGLGGPVSILSAAVPWPSSPTHGRQQQGLGVLSPPSHSVFPFRKYFQTAMREARDRNAIPGLFNLLWLSSSFRIWINKT
jgi:hypothetical protein